MNFRLFPAIEMFSRRQFGELFQVFRAQRIGNGVLFAKPFTQINQPATARAKGAGRPGEPVPYPLARRTFNIPRCQM
jgi:hypothetical protein